MHTRSGANIDLRFPGQWFQSESGLHQNWMRDYDPTTGRYVQADPLGLVDGASVYNYALQNPGRFVDPRGESAQCVVVGYDQNGNQLLDCNNAGGQSLCPGGDCGWRDPIDGIRDEWPAFGECVDECMKGEPVLDPESWLKGNRGVCTLTMNIPSQLIFGKGSKYVSPFLVWMCRRDACKRECLTCEE